jgi:hypothetical protein
MKKIPLCNSLLILFLVAIVAVPLTWFTINKPVRQRSIVEARYLYTFPAPDFRSLKTGVKRILQRKPGEALTTILGQYLNRTYQKKFEAAASDQFPLRLPLIQIARDIGREMIYLAYNPLPDPAIPADMKLGFYVTRDGSRLIVGPNEFNDNIKINLDKHIENFNKIINNHPEKKYYLFYLERLVDSPYHPLNQYFPDSDRGQAFKYFEENKPPNLVLGSLMFSNLNDLLNSYYKTDHHWNIYGIKKSYEEIYRMLRMKHQDLSPMLDLNKINPVTGIKYWGSYARGSLYPISGEQFEISQIELPPYDVNIYSENNTEKRSNLNIMEFEKKEYSNEKYTNYYSAFYGGQNRLIKFDSRNGSNRNLLIIGSSFTRPLAPLLASHYRTTYLIDLRKFPDFSLSKFLSTHPVDDILIVANDFMLYRDEWLINP